MADKVACVVKVILSDGSAAWDVYVQDRAAHDREMEFPCVDESAARKLLEALEDCADITTTHDEERRQ